MKRRSVPVRLKLVAMMLASSVIALALMVGVLTWHEVSRYTIARAQDLDTQTELLAASLTAALRFRDHEAARENLHALRFRQRVLSAAVYEADGTIFATYIRDSAPAGFPHRPMADGVAVIGADMVAFKRIVHDGEILGTAYIRTELGARERLEQFLFMSGVAGLAALLVALLSAVWLQRTITRPIGLINRAARGVVEEKSYEHRAEKVTDDEVGALADSFNVMLDEIQARTRALERAEAELRALNDDLERRIEGRTAELESFSYTVSHDLRSPLRAIAGFAHELRARLPDDLDAESVAYFERIRAAIRRMSQRIDGLLDLAQLSRRPLAEEPVDLGALAREAIADLSEREPDRDVAVDISGDLAATGDPELIRALMDNLVQNAWKFTASTPEARIEVGAVRDGHRTVYFVRDNGAGFDMEFADKLFKPFQRVHAVSEYPGTGIGLATARRIVERHGGRIWAVAEVGRGAEFRFTLNAEDD